MQTAEEILLSKAPWLYHSKVYKGQAQSILDGFKEYGYQAAEEQRKMCAKQALISHSEQIEIEQHILNTPLPELK